MRSIFKDKQEIICHEDGSIEFIIREKDGVCYSAKRTFGHTVNGYKRVWINGKDYNVHRLIAEAFHPNQDNLPEVDHINRDRSDNRPCNLRWVDRATNAQNKGSYEGASITRAKTEKYVYDLLVERGIIDEDAKVVRISAAEVYTAILTETHPVKISRDTLRRVMKETGFKMLTRRGENLKKSST